MRIESSQVRFEAQRTYMERTERRENLRAEARPVPQQRVAEEVVFPDPEEVDPRLKLFRLVLEALLGAPRTGAPRPATQDAAVQNAPPRVHWSASVEQTQTHTEQEILVVKAHGGVRTDDGREIRFNAEFTLAREFCIETSSSIRAGNAQVSDPLFLDTNRGLLLLVHDADGDGRVSNDGELFGARTGDGFSELAAFDVNSNGWLDAADPVMGQLRLRLEDGTFGALERFGIGALSTTGQAGEFQYKNASNELTAIVRRTGIYLTESGQAGALRQIDLVSG